MCDHSVQWSLAAVQLLKVKSACAEASQQWDNTPFKTVSWLYLSWTFDLTLKSQTGTYRYRSVCFFSGEIRNPDGGSLLLWESPLCMCLQVQLVAVQQCSMVTQSSQTFCSAHWGSSAHWPPLSSRQAPTCHLCLVAMISAEQLTNTGLLVPPRGGMEVLTAGWKALLTLGFNKDSSWDCLCTLKCDWCWLRNCKEFDGGLLPPAWC